MEWKGNFQEAGIVLHNFSSGTILSNMIRTNQLEFWPKVKLSDPDWAFNSLNYLSMSQNVI